MDALSDLLRVLHFEGGLFLDSVFRAPWCIRSQVTDEDCGIPGAAAAAGVMGFHFVLDGRIQVQLQAGDEPPRTANAGDLILLTGNDPHLLGSDLKLPTLAVESLIRKAGEHEFPHISYGDGDGAVLTRFVCGYLATPMQLHPLFGSFPKVLITNMQGRPGAEWVESSFRFAAREHATRRPASQGVLARLSELLFLEAVRDHLELLPPNATGWLAAVRDPALARALSALHGRVAHPWTTESLAEEALLSRSAFAERFTRTLGVPPMTYMTQWRMLVAAQRLRESPASIARIAADVGYESEATFSRAFSREMGVAPGRYRHRAAF